MVNGLATDAEWLVVAKDGFDLSASQEVRGQHPDAVGGADCPAYPLPSRFTP